MCRTVPGSGSNRIVLYTVDKPYSTKRPGFLMTGNDIQFTDDIWGARTWASRNDIGEEQTFLQRKTKLRLMTHQATAQLTVPR